MLEVIGGWPGAVWLRQSATAYLFVNAAHILGVAVLLGADPARSICGCSDCSGDIPSRCSGPFSCAARPRVWASPC